MKLSVWIFVALLTFRGLPLAGQEHDIIVPKLLDQQWDAYWISHPEISRQAIGAYLFRKEFSLRSIPQKFIVHISADNRYKLYVNGQPVCQGPARGDRMHWRYETIDISSYLKNGKNVIAAQVWYLGHLMPGAQMSTEAGLIVQGNTDIESIVNTNQSWKVLYNSAISFFPITHLQTYFVAGPGEKFDSRLFPWGWQDEEFDDLSWSTAQTNQKGSPFKSIRKHGILPMHALQPRQIPFMETREQSFSRVRQIENMKNASALLNEQRDLIIPANRKVSILLDQDQLTTAYPRLNFSGGQNSEIQITYAESLFEVETIDGKEMITKNKGNRNDIQGKKIWGYFDSLICDGGINRSFESLWWRTFRYVQLDINTKNDPLTLHQFNSIFTAYPLQFKASLHSDEELVSDITKVGWQTQRLCAGETFFDCPYYEQLQYVGDTRIQALVTFYASGDTLLWRKAISDFYDSRISSGITQSRYPGYDMQLIPTYSLVWVSMLHDYLMHGNDEDFIKMMLPAVQDILQWFELRSGKPGTLGKLEGWNFVDWVNHEGWDAGIPPLKDGAQSSVIDLQYLYSIQKAIELFDHFGSHDISQKWKDLSEIIKQETKRTYWDEKKRLMADTPDKTLFSQHANILGILTQTISTDLQKEVTQKILNDSSMAQSTYYFRFYLTEVLREVGMADQYLETLGPWETMLKNGLTTFAEKDEPSRSDCHAWSASPIYHFYSLVAGITPDSVGFHKVRIAPNLGKLKKLKGEIPHRMGSIGFDFEKVGKDGIQGQVVLPDGLTGDFIWKGVTIELKEGSNSVKQ